jgi:hypothetical protein
MRDNDEPDAEKAAALRESEEKEEAVDQGEKGNDASDSDLYPLMKSKAAEAKRPAWQGLADQLMRLLAQRNQVNDPDLQSEMEALWGQYRETFRANECHEQASSGWSFASSGPDPDRRGRGVGSMVAQQDLEIIGGQENESVRLLSRSEAALDRLAELRERRARIERTSQWETEPRREPDPLFPVALELQENVGPGPGAFRVFPGSIERASMADLSSDDSVESHLARRAAPPSSLNRHSSIYMVEADLVSEDESEPAPALLLVEAKLIRRKQQLVLFALLSLAVVAIIVGLSVGLTANRPVLTPAPTTEAPTLSPTSQLDQLFRPTLPPYTLESLRNRSSPQYLAYEWVTEVDEIPWIQAPNDEPLRFARMKQRFALATLFFATGGARTWKKQRFWLNTSIHECRWSRCGCTFLATMMSILVMITLILRMRHPIVMIGR